MPKGIFKHHNMQFSGNVPLCTDDVYWAEDKICDLRYMKEIGPYMLAKLQPTIPMLFSGGVVTQGSGLSLDITALFGIVMFATKIPDTWALTPPATTTVNAYQFVETPQITNYSLSGYTTGGTTWYVYVSYAEANLNQRSVLKGSGTYYYETEDSYTITISTNGALGNTYLLLGSYTVSGGTTVNWTAQPYSPFSGYLSTNSYNTTATAGGTTTLNLGSAYQQFFTGSAAQTIVMPVVSTLALGWTVLIVNNSTGVLTINSSDGNTILTLGSSCWTKLTCISLSGTGTSSWSYTASALLNYHRQIYTTNSTWTHPNPGFAITMNAYLVSGGGGGGGSGYAGGAAGSGGGASAGSGGGGGGAGSSSSGSSSYGGASVGGGGGGGGAYCGGGAVSSDIGKLGSGVLGSGGPGIASGLSATISWTMSGSGGGRGGAGNCVNGGAGVSACSGGGGGGGCRLVRVTGNPISNITIVVGTGGAGGTAGTSGVASGAGTDGVDSTISGGLSGSSATSPQYLDNYLGYGQGGKGGDGVVTATSQNGNAGTAGKDGAVILEWWSIN